MVFLRTELREGLTVAVFQHRNSEFALELPAHAQPAWTPGQTVWVSLE
jgi:hypothetical protein